MTTTITEIAAEFSKGNFEAACPHFDENVCWEIVGDKAVKGKSDVADFCGKMTTEIAGSQLVNTNIIVAGNNVAIEGNCHYTNADNKQAQVQYCDIYCFENGKIRTITSYCINSIIAPVHDAKTTKQ